MRLITLLALDRFGDFVSDSVVAPVRETAAQALGIATKLLSEDSVQKIIEILSVLIQHGYSTKNDNEVWPIRHGGLLGLRWIFAVNQKLLEYNFSFLFKLICCSLEDESDDCRQGKVEKNFRHDNYLFKMEVYRSKNIIFIEKLFHLQ